MPREWALAILELNSPEKTETKTEFVLQCVELGCEKSSRELKLWTDLQQGPERSIGLQQLFKFKM